MISMHLKRKRILIQDNNQISVVIVGDGFKTLQMVMGGQIVFLVKMEPQELCA